MALCRVHAMAPGSRSTAVTRAPGCSCAIASARAPEPLPRSTTIGPSSAGQPVERPAGQLLGLRPGHEDAGADGELEVAERGAAGQVLQRHAVGPLLEERAEPGGVVAIGTSSRVSSRPRGDAQDVGEQQFGVHPRRLDPGVGEPAGGVGQQRPDVQEPAASSSAVCAVDQRVDDGVEVAVDDLVEVVRLVADAVVGDPVLREVVGAHPLAAVHRAHLAAPLVAAVASASSRAAASSRERSTRSADSRFCSWLFSFCELTTMPLGRWVIRTAESVDNSRAALIIERGTRIAISGLSSGSIVSPWMAPSRLEVVIFDDNVIIPPAQSLVDADVPVGTANTFCNVTTPP